MKARIISAFLAAMLVLTTLGFYACSGGDNGGDTTDASDVSENTSEWSANEEWSYVSKKGAITVGYIPSKPMNFSDKKGALVGFDSEIARIVFSRLGLNTVFMEVDEASAQKMLESKKIDCIWGGFTVTDKSSQSFELTKGYMINRQVVVAGKDDVKKYAAAASLKKASLTAAEGSDGEKLVSEKKLSHSYTAADSQEAALLRVLDGKADAAIVGSVTAYYLINTDKAFSGLTILDGKDMRLDDGVLYAAAFRKSGAIEVEKVNGILEKLAEEGVLSTVAKKYGLTDCVQL